MKNKKTISILIALLLLAITFSANAQNWDGQWVRKGGCDLKITNVTASEFTFSFNCFNGKNFGELEGKVIINGNKARYSGEADGLCPINFTLTEKGLKVEEDRTKDCENGAGNGVYFSGDYAKKGSPVKKTKKK
ncbi:MAG: hypothetical protein NTW25_14515 [Candidatus Kapabacteria bacterium]|nr:hypothetical protein [Candidatus Kapabacteria bacterium]